MLNDQAVEKPGVVQGRSACKPRTPPRLRDSSGHRNQASATAVEHHRPLNRTQVPEELGVAEGREQQAVLASLDRLEQDASRVPTKSPRVLAPLPLS